MAQSGINRRQTGITESEPVTVYSLPDIDSGREFSF
jgi:hypothetical protein